MEAFGNQTEPELSTENDPVAAYIGEAIRNSGAKLFLDVGSGVKPQTSYMDVCGEDVKWLGVDPVLGDLTRRYPFVQGTGKSLPSRSRVFESELLSLVMDNLLDPRR